MTTPENSGGEMVSAAAWTAAFVPQWMKQETEYAFTKFNGQNNPQRTALEGGLLGDGHALVEIANYFGNFRTFAEQSQGDPDILVLASRQLGKYVNAVRVTNVFMAMEDAGLSLEQADERVMDQLERICRTIESVPRFEAINLEDYYQRHIEPAMGILARLIDQKHPDRLQFASDFLRRQVELFIAFTNYAGVIAQPGPEAARWTID